MERLFNRLEKEREELEKEAPLISNLRIAKNEEGEVPLLRMRYFRAERFFPLVFFLSRCFAQEKVLFAQQRHRWSKSSPFDSNVVETNTVLHITNMY